MTSNTGLVFFVFQPIRHHLFGRYVAAFENDMARLKTKDISGTGMGFHLQALVWSAYQQ